MNRFHPRLEAFEDRRTPAAFLSGDILYVTGGNANDSVHIAENFETEQTTVSHNGQTWNFDADDFDSIRVYLYGGSNALNYQVTGDEVDLDRQFRYFGGDSFDYVTYDLRGWGAEITDDIDIHIQTYGGNDAVGIFLPTVDDADVNVSAHLGDNNDSFTALLTGDLKDDANVAVAANGGGGNDHLEVSAHFDVDVDAAADLFIGLNGNAGDDYMEVRYRGEMDGEVYVDLFGEGGDDRAVITAVFDHDSDGYARLREFGGDDYDRLTINVTNNSGRAGALDYDTLRDWS